MDPAHGALFKDYSKPPGAAVPKRNTPPPPTGDIVAGKQLYYPSWKPKIDSTLITSILSVVMYGSAAVFILLIILTIINFTIYPIFSFSPNDFGIITIPTASDKQTAYTASPAGLDASANLINVIPCSYSLGMDIFLTGGFVPQVSPRILLYESMTPIDISGAAAVDSFYSKFPNSNLIVWIDPVLNDLSVSVFTKDLSGGPVVVETTPPIQNLPIQTAFRITYVFTSEFIELYRNGTLEISMPFKNPPILGSSPPYFFPPSTSTFNSCKIGNLYYWNRTITAREVSTYGNPVASNTFFTK